MILASGRIDVWCADLDEIDVSPSVIRCTLSVEERERAARFRFERDRQDYERCRYMVRLLLGSYLGIKPARVRFRYGKHGKPESEDYGRIRFNVSRSHGCAFFACCPDLEVGVDLEYVVSFR